jgi:large subunit ribosomal protein L3e
MSKYAQKWANGAKEINAELEKIKKYCSVVRVIAHTQIKLVTGVHQKKAHVMEIQLNGGSVADKVDFAKNHFEKTVAVTDVFKPSEMIDTIGITRGHGFEGVITRWGVTRLPRKTHKGLRKVACIGSWHPARIRFTVARAGQHGYHHRTHINSKIYRIGKKDDPSSCTTETDLTKKGINPMGGFVNYGLINEDWIMVKGAVVGPRKRVITLRKSLGNQKSRFANEQINLKFIDTSSKLGHGRFQTSEEKDKWMGPTLRRERAADNIAVNKGAASAAMTD